MLSLKWQGVRKGTGKVRLQEHQNKFREMKETRTRAAAVINKSTRNEKFKLKVIGTSPKTYELVIILKKTTQLVMF